MAKGSKTVSARRKVGNGGALSRLWKQLTRPSFNAGRKFGSGLTSGRYLDQGKKK